MPCLSLKRKLAVHLTNTGAHFHFTKTMMHLPATLDGIQPTYPSTVCMELLSWWNMTCLVPGVVFTLSGIHDLTASLLAEVCPEVCTKPQLQLLNGEHLLNATALKDDCVRLVIAVEANNLCPGVCLIFVSHTLLCYMLKKKFFTLGATVI